MSNIKSKIFMVNLSLLVVIMAIFTLANPTPTFSEEVCKGTREQCQKELEQTQKELEQSEKELSRQKGYTGTITKNIRELENAIASKKKIIFEKQKRISELSANISKKNTEIFKLGEQISGDKNSLAGLLRRKNDIQRHSLTEFLFSEHTVSNFYSVSDSIKPIQGNLHSTINVNKENKSETEDERARLEIMKRTEAEKKKKEEIEKRNKEYDESQKKIELILSKKIEKETETTIAAKKKKITAIKAKLFELAGFDGKGIPFGQAYQYAKEAGDKIGLNPAVILAILKQESGIGRNVGTCYVTDPNSGYGVNLRGDRYKVMHPTRDYPVFKLIADSLGFNPEKQKVSCAYYNKSRGEYQGWGGAMGPSQFIPSTWIIYKNRIEKHTGSGGANPWNARHAIYATALLMHDNGARMSEESIKTAACKYFSGRACGIATGATGYGNSVLGHVRAIQRDIDTINN